jgi:nitrate reductase molybdenum cofactor assembly chaperone NarJ/NarW
MSSIFTPKSTQQTLRALAWLLRYPDVYVRASHKEVYEAISKENALSPARIGEIKALVTRLSELPAMQVESDYVECFDRGRRTALYLFEHVHGDSRDRGPAMIDLVKTYEQAGLFLGDGELPDYLPVVLEFASTQPPKEARAFLAETANILRAIFTALVNRQSPFASVIAATLELAGEKAERVKIAEELDIDESWAEPLAFGGCSTAGQSAPAKPQTIQIVRPIRDRIAA